MGRIVYEPASNEVIETTRTLIKTFPDKFLHVKLEDIHFIFKDAEKSRVKAYVQLFKGELQTLTKKKIMLCVWKQDWESSTEATRAFIIYHELTHIQFNEEKNKYVMRDHNVKDFKENLELFGLSREKIDSVFSEIITKTADDNKTAAAN